jgi:hypothetical protein
LPLDDIGDPVAVRIPVAEVRSPVSVRILDRLWCSAAIRIVLVGEPITV